MWKQWCGIGKNTDLQTDWHPVALSIHVTTVHRFRTEDSWGRWIILPLVWFLAWECPSLTLTPHGIAGLLPRVSHWQSVVQCSESLSCCEIQPVLRPQAPAVLEGLWVSLVPRGVWRAWLVGALQLAQSSGNAPEGSDSPFFPSSLHIPKYTLMPCFHCQIPPNRPL